jgi:hypothetical protein
VLTKNESEVLRIRMMECSESRIESAAQDDEGAAQQAANRVLESAQSWREWTGTHNRLVSSVARIKGSTGQVRAVKRMAVSMIHRKAPFEYLRDESLRGAERRQFFQSFYNSQDYARSLVGEHRNYVNSVCSYLCVDSFCSAASLRLIQGYERAYTQFWRAQARAQLRAQRRLRIGGQQGGDLTEYLRNEVSTTRKLLVDTDPTVADKHRLEELRRPTGDTVRIRRGAQADWSAI